MRTAKKKKVKIIAANANVAQHYLLQQNNLFFNFVIFALFMKVFFCWLYSAHASQHDQLWPVINSLNRSGCYNNVKSRAFDCTIFLGFLHTNISRLSALEAKSPIFQVRFVYRLCVELFAYFKPMSIYYKREKWFFKAERPYRSYYDW